MEGEFLFAFLDDVNIMAPPARIRFLYDLLGSKLGTPVGSPDFFARLAQEQLCGKGKLERGTCCLDFFAKPESWRLIVGTLYQ